MPAFRWSAINGGASAPSWGSFSDRNRTGGAASAVRSCAVRPSNNSVPVPTFLCSAAAIRSGREEVSSRAPVSAPVKPTSVRKSSIARAVPSA
jgi:hypothetical protein